MKGGTYARALEVGFDEKQAAFFAHLAMDTRNEIMCEVNEREEGHRKSKESIARGSAYAFALLFVVFILGLILGAMLS